MTGSLLLLMFYTHLFTVSDDKTMALPIVAFNERFTHDRVLIRAKAQ